MKYKCEVITYCINKKIAPSQVAEVLFALLSRYSISYERLLWRIESLITEFEFDGVFHSNRKNNNILKICRKYPELEKYFQHTKNGDDERYIISNFDEKFALVGSEKNENTIREIAYKIPRPYGVNDFQIIIDGIDFSGNGGKREEVRLSLDGLGPLIGNYISYERTVYGSERHCSINFVRVCDINDLHNDDMRKIYFEFVESIPGKYEGTILLNPELLNSK